MNRWIYLMAALAGGIALPFQVAVNSFLRSHLAQPMQVTFVSYSVGALGSLAFCLLARYPLPTGAAIAGTSWWMWCAGLLGVGYVWSTIFSTPHIGAALALSLTVAGQLIAAVGLDHFGALGLTRYPLNGIRTLGLALVIGGAALIASDRS